MTVPIAIHMISTSNDGCHYQSWLVEITIACHAFQIAPAIVCCWGKAFPRTPHNGRLKALCLVCCSVLPNSGLPEAVWLWHLGGPGQSSAGPQQAPEGNAVYQPRWAMRSCPLCPCSPHFPVIVAHLCFPWWSLAAHSPCNMAQSFFFLAPGCCWFRWECGLGICCPICALRMSDWGTVVVFVSTLRMSDWGSSGVMIVDLLLFFNLINADVWLGICCCFCICALRMSDLGYVVVFVSVHWGCLIGDMLLFLYLYTEDVWLGICCCFFICTLRMSDWGTVVVFVSVHWRCLIGDLLGFWLWICYCSPICSLRMSDWGYVVVFVSVHWGCLIGDMLLFLYLYTEYVWLGICCCFLSAHWECLIGELLLFLYLCTEDVWLGNCCCFCIRTLKMSDWGSSGVLIVDLLLISNLFTEDVWLGICCCFCSCTLRMSDWGTCCFCICMLKMTDFLCYCWLNALFTCIFIV